MNDLVQFCNTLLPPFFSVYSLDTSSYDNDFYVCLCVGIKTLIVQNIVIFFYFCIKI